MQYTADDLPPIEAIMPILRFTAEDLQANYAGTLGPNQQAQLRAQQTRLIALGTAIFFILAFLATLLLFVGALNSWIVASLAGILTTIINALLIGAFGRQWMRLRADLRQDAVLCLKGDVERVVRANSRLNNFVLRVDDQDFYVKKELFNLVRHGVPYTLYLTPHSRHLLALEPSPND